MSAEVPVVFGPERNLLGLWHPAEQRGADVAFLFVNAGVVHRIGTHRINVKIARALGAMGASSLRFDLSGLGDSRARRTALDFGQQAVADIRSAMDYLERIHSIRRFVIFGVCSGAHNALAVAQVDPRVVGVAMLDGYAYPTFRTRLNRVRLRAQRRTLAGNLLHGIRFVLRVLQPGNRRRTPAPFAAPSAKPTREQYAETLDALHARGAAICCIFTGSGLETFNHAGQWAEAFRGRAFLSSAQCHYLPEIDHTVTSLEAQRKLIDLLGAWAVAQRWAAQGALASRESP